jgi:hypothetical protein
MISLPQTLKDAQNSFSLGSEAAASLIEFDFE